MRQWMLSLFLAGLVLGGHPFHPARALALLCFLQHRAAAPTLHRTGRGAEVEVAASAQAVGG